jgi:hypothetical protein
MLPLLCAAIVFAFLALGAAVFTATALIPPLRRYSLSAALWCAVWGPCSVAWIVLTGFVVVASGFVMETVQSKQLHLPEIPHALWTSYGILAIAGTAVLATGMATVHQWVLHRMTFALFRIYAGLVSAGIGSVWGWGLLFWLTSQPELPLRLVIAILAMLLLSAGFGYAGFRGARQLRGKVPENFAFVSPRDSREPTKP